MIDVLLQLDAARGFNYPVLLLVTLIAMVLGLFIAFQAYSGYRRNVSRSLLFLALGITLLTVGPFVVSLLLTLVGTPLGVESGIYLYWMLVATRLFEIGGFICILYSLRIRQ